MSKALENLDQLHMATWLLVGWRRSWRLRQVLDAVGIQLPHSQDEAAAIGRHFSFMPSDWAAYSRGSCQVRAFVAATWPKLSAYLLANEQRPDKLLKAVNQIARLDGKRETRANNTGLLKKEDRAECNMASNELRRVEAANRAARRQQLSNQRSAWNVCKA